MNDINFGKKIRLVVIAKHIDGGTGTFALQLTKLAHLYRNKYEFELLVLEKPRFRSITSKVITISYHRETQYLPYFYLLNISTLYRFAKEYQWIQNSINKISPDIILTVDSHCGMLGGIYKLTHTNIKLVATFHNNLSAVVFKKLSPFSSHVLRFLCGFIFKNADGVVGVSKGVAGDISNFFRLKNNVRTIYYGVTMPQYSKVSKIETNYKKDKKKMILSIARMDPQKDFVTLIKSLKYIADHKDNYCLYLLGDGEHRIELEQMVKEQHLQNNVRFLGWKNNVKNYFRKAHVFVLSSHFEGFPYVLLEAMSWGIPIISTDTPYGPREMLEQNKYGIIVPMENPKIMAEAITKILTDKKLYMYYKIQSHTRSVYYSEERMLNDYHRLFLKLST